jgi:hypothetical protein
VVKRISIKFPNIPNCRSSPEPPLIRIGACSAMMIRRPADYERGRLVSHSFNSELPSASNPPLYGTRRCDRQMFWPQYLYEFEQRLMEQSQGSLYPQVVYRSQLQQMAGSTSSSRPLFRGAWLSAGSSTKSATKAARLCAVKALSEMGEGAPVSACRSRLQTTPSCEGKEPWW